MEGVIYYLGEYIRSPEPPVKLKRDEPEGGADLPILVVKPTSNAPPNERFVQVDYRGVT